MSDDPLPVLVSVRDLVVEYRQRDGSVARAVDGVSFDIPSGSCFGLVGESGSGKTTAARSLLRLVDAQRGRIAFDGEDITHASRKRLRALRRGMQLIYQDPQASLDSRMTTRQLVEETLLIHEKSLKRTERLSRVSDVLRQVGLGDEYLDARPGSLSGGQMQRVAIARALALRPKLLVCDEVVSALDVSVQAQILNLLRRLQRELDLTMLFISHDLGVVSYLCDYVGVMLDGRIVDQGQTADVLAASRNPYTLDLIESCPDPDPERGRAARVNRMALAGDTDNR